MRLLLAEDEPGIAEHLRRSLTAVGYVVDHAADGEEAHFLGDTEPYDAVVLDLGLPKRDGLSVLRAWRACGHRMPVLILTARDSWREKVDGIDAGADDYLAKPFATEELLARLRALLRRTGGHADPVLRHGALELDTRSGRVTLAGTAMTLTAMEYRILAYLMHRPDRVVSQSESGRARLRPRLRPRFQHDRGHGRPRAPQAGTRRHRHRPWPRLPAGRHRVMRWGSLRLRLLAAGAVLVVLAVAAAGFALSSLFRAHLDAQYDDELVLQLDGLTAALQLDAGGRPALRSLPTDSRFATPYGGRYWQIELPGSARAALALAMGPRAAAGRGPADSGAAGPARARRAGDRPGPRGRAACPFRSGAGPGDPGRRGDAGGRNRCGRRPVRSAASDHDGPARRRPRRGLGPPGRSRAHAVGASRAGARGRAQPERRAVWKAASRWRSGRWWTSSTVFWPSRSGPWSAPAGRRPIWRMP